MYLTTFDPKKFSWAHKQSVIVHDQATFKELEGVHNQKKTQKTPIYRKL
jgi:hypothetical protein